MASRPGINGMALFYNKDLLQAAGIQPPTTWAGVKDTSAKLSKGGVYGIAFSAPVDRGRHVAVPAVVLGSRRRPHARSTRPEAVNRRFSSGLTSSRTARRRKSVVQWNQGDVNDQFLAGKAAMQQND